MKHLPCQNHFLKIWLISFEIFMVTLYFSGSMSPLFCHLYHNIINANCSVRICVHSCEVERRLAEIYQVAWPAGAAVKPRVWNSGWLGKFPTPVLLLAYCSLVLFSLHKLYFSMPLTGINIPVVWGRLPPCSLVKFYLDKKLRKY